MDNWKPTHKTRPGVEVMVEDASRSRTELVKAKLPGSSPGDGFLLSYRELDALFEKIHEPVMVAIPHFLALTIRDNWLEHNNCPAHQMFTGAIAAAERAAEAKP